jgi:multicomponent K+:H+ antiporter subunit D
LIGDWPAPYGIVLVADRLSALMLTLTSALAVAVIAHLSLSPDAGDRSGHHFHALLQFQLFGLAGAFLTADLFNLFVFFEVLLIASYGLLVQGGGPARSRAALHYVVLNMVGSSLFLMGVASLYAVTGTLNLAQLSGRLLSLSPDQAPLAGAGLMLLTGAFALKAALVPLHAWLVPAYSAALAPVAALFAIMTKVGIYALLRLIALMPIGAAFSDGAVVELPLAKLPIQAVLTTGALLTLAASAIGVVVAAELRRMIAYLVLISVGTLLAGVAVGTADGIAAGLYCPKQG